MQTYTQLDTNRTGSAPVVIRSLAHIGIRIRNFDRAITFYRQLGFHVTRDDPRERVVVLKHESGLELNLLDSVSGDGSRNNVLMDHPRRHPGYTHIALRVADVQRAREQLVRLGIPLTEGPVTFGDGSTSIFFRDPDRNVIELAQADGGVHRSRLQGVTEQ
ncbi:MAG: VOC family protein [Sedimenticola sp.]|nr:VOC family protein [Sedimenticola sp.]